MVMEFKHSLVGFKYNINPPTFICCITTQTLEGGTASIN